jgi:hypothetical protein
MKVNFFVEDMLFFKYIGCATAARSLFRSLGERNDIDIAYNDRDGPFDLVHYHTFGPLALFHKKRHNGVSVLTAHSTPSPAFPPRLSRTVSTGIFLSTIPAAGTRFGKRTGFPTMRRSC